MRALIVDVEDGRIVSQALHAFAHGVIDQQLPDSTTCLPIMRLQHPADWLESRAACTEALGAASIDPRHVLGIGVDFTSCTMLPVARWHAHVHGRWDAIESAGVAKALEASSA